MRRQRKRLPAIGRDVVGSIYCPLDGHVNSLRLFRSLHQAMERHGVVYRPNCAVETITPMVQGFAVKGFFGELRASKLVLAAGLGNARLAPMVGLKAPVIPSKGADHRHREGRALPSLPHAHAATDRRGWRHDRRQPGRLWLRHYRYDAGDLRDGRARGAHVSPAWRSSTWSGPGRPCAS